VTQRPTRHLSGGAAWPADGDAELDRDDGADAAAAGRSPFEIARRSRQAIPWPVVGVVSAGGVLGALARYSLDQAFPHRPDEFAWATFGINVTGCLLIGVLMVLIAQVWPTRRLLRPFLGTGLLGGYTTFSTYVVDIQHMVAADAARTALVYLAGTLVAAIAAVYAGITATRLVLDRLRHHRGTP
jgi:CrcB protein